MGKHLAILFTFLYLMAMLRPVAPFLDYYCRYDYIVKNLCVNKDKPEMHCNGKCYLMRQLKKNQNKGAQQKKGNLILKENYPIGFIQIVEISSQIFPVNFSTGNFQYMESYSFLFQKNIFHPPAC